MVGPSSQISKILLTLLFFLVIFYIAMDVQLYIRIHNYTIERNYHLNGTSGPDQLLQSTANYNQFNYNNYYKNGEDIKNKFSSIVLSSSEPNYYTNSIIKRNNKMVSSSYIRVSSNLNSYNTLKLANISQNNLIQWEQNQKKYEETTWISCDINPLCDVTVKAILLDHTNHYLFAPLATIFDNIVGFSRSTFITANMISFFHVLVACLSGRLVASDNLGYRRLGVVLFQFRTFLDDLDGHVARVKKNIRGERSEVGTSGYYIDGICDGLGCIALIIGITFFLKNNPPRRGYTQLQAVLPVTINDTKGSPEAGVVYRVKVTTKKVARKVLCFAGQLLLSSTAWNRYIALYQDMLERTDVTLGQFLKQNVVFKSNWFFSVAWIWRVVNVHSLLHCILLSIFCDKLWDFLKLIQFSGVMVLIVSICATEMHILEVQNFIFNSLTGNNTAL